MAVMTESREQAIRDLTRHCGDGRITLGELEERIDEVNRATTDEEIRHALRELPVVAHDPVAPPVDEPVYRDEDDVDERSYEHVIPDDVLSPPPLPGGSCGPALRRHRREDATGIEKTLRTVWVISGFIAIFNGLWWLAIILWFVVPKLVLPNLRRI
jgi:hypothetical protein